MNRKNLSLVMIVLTAVVAGLLLGNILAVRSFIGHGNPDSLFRNFITTDNKIQKMIELIDNEYVDSVDLADLTEQMAA